MGKRISVENLAKEIDSIAPKGWWFAGVWRYMPDGNWKAEVRKPGNYGLGYGGFDTEINGIGVTADAAIEQLIEQLGMRTLNKPAIPSLRAQYPPPREAHEPLPSEGIMSAIEGLRSWHEPG